MHLIFTSLSSTVSNVARYYYRTAVFVDGAVDDVSTNAGRGLNFLGDASSRLGQTSATASGTPGAPRRSRSRSSHLKRQSSETDLPEQPSKRSYLASPTKFSIAAAQNRVHQRLIVCDYSKPVYEASSRKTLLMAFEQYLKGDKSLFREGILHRDISINNLLISDDEKRAFLLILQ